MMIKIEKTETVGEKYINYELRAQENVVIGNVDGFTRLSARFSGQIELEMN